MIALRTWDTGDSAAIDLELWGRLLQSRATHSLGQSFLGRDASHSN